MSRPHYRSPFEQMGDRMERLALLDRHPAAFGAESAAGRKRKREADDDDKLSVHVPDLLNLVLVDGRKDMGKFTLIVPENVEAEIPDEQPTAGVTRIDITEGQPTIEAGRFLDLLMGFVSMEPVIPWVEIDNQFRSFSVRIEPWKTVTWEITR